MKKKLSIITINYNNLAGLEKTIASVVQQTYSNFEYIMIDGGSTDGGCEFLENNKEKFSYVVSEPDNGIYNAMNKGIKASNGEYLLFLNSGDVLNGETALNDFINNPLFSGDIIYGDYQFEKGNKVYPDILTPLFFIKSSLPHQSTFFKRTVFDTMGFYDEKYEFSADREFFIKCLLSNEIKFSHIEYFLTIFDLSGFSNNPNYLKKRKIEHKLLFTENYHIFFEDYKNYIKLEKEVKLLKRKTIKGILKRIVNKFINIKKRWLKI